MAHIAKVVVDLYESSDGVRANLTLSEGDLEDEEVLAALLLAQQRAFGGDDEAQEPLVHALEAWVMDRLASGDNVTDICAALTQVQLAVLTGEPATEGLIAGLVVEA